MRLAVICFAGLVCSAAMLAQYNGSTGAQNSGTFHPAIQPFHMPQSVGLSPRSIGLSPSPVGFVGIPSVSPLSAPANNRGGGRGGHGRNNRPAYPIFGIPYFGYSPDMQSAPEPVTAESGANNLELSDQVKRLSTQLHDLQDQLTRNTTQPAPPPPEETASTPAAPPVTVVLTNGRTIQTGSYAVVGDTFWDLSNQPARRIPIANINVPASVKATEADGVEFPAIGPKR